MKETLELTAPPVERYRLVVVTSHPVQYQAPLFRQLARHPSIDLTVYYGNDSSLANTVDPDFGIPVVWDRPLLDGYRSVFLTHCTKPITKSSRLAAYSHIILDFCRNRYDAVFIHGYATPFSALAYLAAWISRTPVLLRTESELLRARATGLKVAKRLFLNLLFHGTAAFLVIGSANREFYMQHRVVWRKMYQTPYCVDNDYFAAKCQELRPRRAELKQALGFPPALPVITFSGKLIERKRPMDLAMAYQQLVEAGTSAGLLIIGEGRLRSELEDFFAAQQLPHVRLVGFKNQTELPECYVCGDVLVLPSAFETWGLVVNEGMLFGMPVITTDMVGAARDLIENDVTGYVYPVGDVPGLARLLQGLLSDPEKRLNMGGAAQRRVSKLNYQACVEGIVKALQDIHDPHHLARQEVPCG